MAPHVGTKSILCTQQVGNTESLVLTALHNRVSSLLNTTVSTWVHLRSRDSLSYPVMHPALFWSCFKKNHYLFAVIFSSLHIAV